MTSSSRVHINFQCAIRKISHSLVSEEEYIQLKFLPRWDHCLQSEPTKHHLRNLLIVKADEYYKSLWTENSPQRVILLNNVVMGNAMKLQSNRKGLIRVGKLLLRTKTSQLTAYKPPDGYHSVVGEPGNILSYPEAVGECLIPSIRRCIRLIDGRLLVYDVCAQVVLMLPFLF